MISTIAGILLVLAVGMCLVLFPFICLDDLEVTEAAAQARGLYSLLIRTISRGCGAIEIKEGRATPDMPAYSRQQLVRRRKKPRQGYGGAQVRGDSLWRGVAKHILAEKEERSTGLTGLLP
jgi:hypothetical protein